MGEGVGQTESTSGLLTALYKGAIVNPEASPIYTKNALDYWYNEIQLKAKGTQKNYKDYFQRFLEYINMNADQVLNLRIQDSKSDNMQTKHRFESLFLDFLSECKSKGYTNGTLQSIYAAIRSFFELHYYPLQMRKKDYPKTTANGVRRATQKAILEITQEENPSLTAKILTANDTGMGVSDLRALNCDIILDNPDKDFIMITKRRIKTGDIIKTFLGEESINALKKYIEIRTKGTPKINPETITGKSPLFVTHKQKRISRECLSSTIEQAFLRHEEKHMSAHSIRKKLQTNLEKGGMNTNWIDQVLGHKLVNSRDAYSLPTDEELKEAYVNAYPCIKITPQEPLTKTAKIQEPQQETNFDVIETHNLEEAKTALSKGYKYADTIDGIRLYTKPTNHPITKINYQLTEGQNG